MNAPFSGGCACGAIRYTCSSPPLAMLSCHCRDCQLSSGAPFASGVVVTTADVTINGKPRTFAVRASSGKLAIRSFCGHCGVPLFTAGEGAPPYMSIRFPTLDDPSAFRPALDIWTSSAQSWVRLSDDIPHFAQSP